MNSSPPSISTPVSESFHTQHSPFGAFASFTIGLVGAPGGFGQSLRGAAKQNVYVGFRAAADKAPWRLLPFFTPPKSQESAFTGTTEVVATDCAMPQLRSSEYTRSVGWASDTWRADTDRFGFSLLSPFTQVPDPAKLRGSEARFLLAPCITGWIEYDNRKGDTAVELMFGIGDPDRPMRPLGDTHKTLTGFAGGTACGYATKSAKGVELRQGFDVFEPKFRDHRGLFVLGGETALVFKVPAGQKRRFPLVLGFYEQGVVTTGISACYAYTRFFKNLEEVLGHGLAQHSRYARLALARDRELESSILDADQRFLLAQSTHSYYGSTQLLWHKGKPLWVVNEGEYRMINTFDLTVDHAFFELAWHPWAVRDTLDLFVDRYSYTDRIRLDSEHETKGGLSFSHDMGVMNNFTPKGRSCYECKDLTGVFSHMTMEQLLNWVLTAVVYAEKTGDLAWLRRQKKVLLACVASMQQRDNPVAASRDGILKFDSDRCGKLGAEITTYDSLDVSLGQARNNLYLSVKALGAWVLLEQAFGSLGMQRQQQEAGASADLLARSLTAKFETDTGFFPAVFENGNRSRILPAVEGFVYPLFLGIEDATDPTGRFKDLLSQLRRHISQALTPGVCIDEKSGGWKISSTSTNTWFSKIAIAQYVVREMFPEAMNPAAIQGDFVHANWQRTPGCGIDALCDQINSENGVSCGSRYYPRGVTSYLWFLE